MANKKRACEETTTALRDAAKKCGFDPDTRSGISKLHMALSENGCSVVPKTVQRWLDGTSYPGPERLGAVCSLLNLSEKEMDELSDAAKQQSNQSERDEPDISFKELPDMPDECYKAARAAKEREELRQWIPHNYYMRRLISNLYWDGRSCGSAISDTLRVAVMYAEFVSEISFYPILQYLIARDWCFISTCAFHEFATTKRAEGGLMARILGNNQMTQKRDDTRYGMFHYLSGCVSVVNRVCTGNHRKINASLSAGELKAVSELSRLVEIWDEGNGKDDEEMLLINIRVIIENLIVLYSHLNDNLVYWRCFSYLILMFKNSGFSFCGEENRTALYETIMFMDRQARETEAEKGVFNG